jgi:hypothetical protein
MRKVIAMVIAVALLSSCASQRSSDFPADAWYQVTSATQILGRGKVFPLLVRDLSKIFSARELARMRSARQAQPDGRVLTELVWKDVDDRCIAYFVTDNSGQSIENFWFNCSAPSRIEALANLGAWLAPFGVAIPEGKTEAEANGNSVHITGGVCPDKGDQWVTKIQFQRE